MSATPEEVTGQVVIDTTEIAPESVETPDKIPAQFVANAGKGRAKGVPNRITRDVRAMVRYLTEARAEQFLGWIDRVAVDEPGRACDIYIRLIETYIPKPQAGFAMEAVQTFDGSALGVRVRGLFGTPEPVTQPLEAGQ